MSIHASEVTSFQARLEGEWIPRVSTPFAHTFLPQAT